MLSKPLLSLTSQFAREQAIKLQSFTGEAAISTLFHYELQFSYADVALDPIQVIGQPATVAINYVGEPTRYYHGIMSELQAEAVLSNGMRQYRAVMRPQLWLLSQTQNRRIFQAMNVLDIVGCLLQEYDVGHYDISQVFGVYEKKNYCVQYDESAFHFIARLLEEAGIFYYFRHAKDKHLLMLADHVPPVPESAQASLSMQESSHGGQRLQAWHHGYQFYPGAYSQGDYNFKLPTQNLIYQQYSTAPLKICQHYEYFEYPGGYNSAAQGEQLTRQRVEALSQGYQEVKATSRHPNLAVAGNFYLRGHESPEENQSYFITHMSVQAGDIALFPQTGGGISYENQLTAIPTHTYYYPPRLTVKPQVFGVHVARVVGKPGDDIYTDEYGRVKIQFLWDRYGCDDHHSSCWVRVMQPAAGRRWGTSWLPRVGQEVLVYFIEGDPDRPVILGGVYNAQYKPPYTLPGKQSITGFKSCSTPYVAESGNDGGNSWYFDDAQGREKIYIQAQKDFEERVIAGDKIIRVEQGTYQLSAEKAIVLSVAGSQIKIDSSGIYINGALVSIN